MVLWEIEVKSGETANVVVGEDKVLMLSEALLGENMEDIEESVFLHITVDGKKLVAGNFHPKRLNHQQGRSLAYRNHSRDSHSLGLGLWLDKDFKISHTLRNASVWFSGSVDDLDPDHKPYYSDPEAYERDPYEERYMEGPSPAFKCAHCCKSCNRTFQTKDVLVPWGKTKGVRIPWGRTHKCK